MDNLSIAIGADDESLYRDSMSDYESVPFQSEGISGELILTFLIPVTTTLIKTLPSIIAELGKFRRRPVFKYKGVELRDISERNLPQLLNILERVQSQKQKRAPK